MYTGHAHTAAGRPEPVRTMSCIPSFPLRRFEVIAIAASTGGPGLVERLVAGLPADLPLPILVAQHLPPQFTVSFAAQLDRAGPLSAVHAADGMPIHPGTVYVGPGRQHLRVVGQTPQGVHAEVSPQPEYLTFKPSADELFRSCAKVYGSKVLAIVLTGIGRDGTEGARAVRDAGGVVLAQDAVTCAVYGMPRSVFEAGFAQAQLTPDDIQRAILQLSPQHRAQAILQ